MKCIYLLRMLPKTILKSNRQALCNMALLCDLRNFEGFLQKMYTKAVKKVHTDLDGRIQGDLKSLFKFWFYYNVGLQETQGCFCKSRQLGFFQLLDFYFKS